MGESVVTEYVSYKSPLKDLDEFSLQKDVQIEENSVLEPSLVSENRS
jgi:hypothetical protein